MLLVIIAFFIGRAFFNLSDKFEKNNWLYAILGALSYFIGPFIGGFALGILNEIFTLGINWDNMILMTMLEFVLGFGSSYLFYFLLKRNWKKNYVSTAVSIDDIGKHSNE